METVVAIYKKNKQMSNFLHEKDPVFGIFQLYLSSYTFCNVW